MVDPADNPPGGSESSGIGGGIGEMPEGQPGYATFYVDVPDVEAALAKAEGLGGTRVMGPETVMEGLVIGLFTDPEGHIIGVAASGLILSARRDELTAEQRQTARHLLEGVVDRRIHDVGLVGLLEPGLERGAERGHRHRREQPQIVGAEASRARRRLAPFEPGDERFVPPTLVLDLVGAQAG